MNEYETIDRELIEILRKSFTFNDIEIIGNDLFGKYSTHELEGISNTLSISPAAASKRLIAECRKRKKFETLIITLIQLEGNYLNDRIVKIFKLENLLYHIAQSGSFYDYKRGKFIDIKDDKTLLPNWGALRDGREYDLTVASIDIAGNSKLVEKHGSAIMEKSYNLLWKYIRKKLEPYDGRIWSWQGDGGLLAFPFSQDVNLSVASCLEIMLALPIYNLHPSNPIESNIVLRIALDHGPIKFATDTGRIVSQSINYAAHLEKHGTSPWGISVSDEVYEQLSGSMRKIFPKKRKFEERIAYSTVVSIEGMQSGTSSKKK